MAKKNNLGTRRMHKQKAIEKAKEDAAALEKKRIARKANAALVGGKESSEAKDGKESTSASGASKKTSASDDLSIFAQLNKSISKLPDAKEVIPTAPKPKSTSTAIVVNKRTKSKIVRKGVSDQKKQMALRRQKQVLDYRAEVHRKKVEKDKMENMASDSEDEGENAGRQCSGEDDKYAFLQKENRPTERRRDVKVRKRVEKRERKGLAYVTESREKRRKRKVLKQKERLRANKRKVPGVVKKTVVKKTGEKRLGA
ncbi:unnamed protein product [Amoebophrya sp. A25]|nr:unnamed protein product [Amoebophrya sp. A25]|eukprot:GSA25T00014663001.1